MIAVPDSSLQACGAVRLRRIFDGLLVTLFLLAATVPLVRLNRPDAEQTIEATERRHAAPFPQFEFRGAGLSTRPRMHSIRLFPSKFEAWFNDHLGGRCQLIRVYNLGKICGLTTTNLGRYAVGRKAQSRVIVGRDGWLFWGDDEQLADFRRLRPFNPAQLARWRNTLEVRRDWLASRGIRYLVYIVPSRETTYAEHMPRSLSRVGSQTRLEQLLVELNHPGGITVLDGRAKLSAAKSRWPTYHKTDTHWNDFGAFIAYEQICETLSGWFPELRPRRLESFEVQVADAAGMELALLADSPYPFREQLVTLTPREPRRARVENLPSLSDGTNNHCSTQPGGELPAAVVLHDSFIAALRPFLSEHFQRVHCVWTHDFPAEVISADRPSVVIQELVEWKLMEYQPQNPPDMDATAESDRLARPSTTTLR